MSFKLVSDAELKRYLDMESDETRWDTLLGELSTQVAAEFEKYLRRSLENTGSRTEVRSLTGRQRILWVSAYPIVSVTSVKEDYLREFGADSVVPATDYFVNANQGLIEHEDRPWYGGNDVVQIVYEGGYTKASDVLVGIPDEWVLAAKQQISFEWQRRKNPGANSITFAGGGAQTFQDIRLLASVKEKLYPSQRKRV